MEPRILKSLRAVATVVVALISFGITGCGQHPRIDVTAMIEDGWVVFDFPHSGINEITTVQVNEWNGEPIWHVSLGSQNWQKGSLKLIYGVVPPRESDLYAPPGQIFPLDNQPPREIRGQTVKVVVAYQYDSGFAACAGSFSKTVKIP